MAPSLEPGQESAKASVPALAANSQVGFYHTELLITEG